MNFIQYRNRMKAAGADKPGRVSFAAQFRGLYVVTNTAVSPRAGLVMDGTWKGPFAAPATGMDGLIARTEGEGHSPGRRPK